MQRHRPFCQWWWRIPKTESIVYEFLYGIASEIVQASWLLSFDWFLFCIVCALIFVIRFWHCFLLFIRQFFFSFCTFWARLHQLWYEWIHRHFIRHLAHSSLSLELWIEKNKIKARKTNCTQVSIQQWLRHPNITTDSFYICGMNI